MLGIENQEIGAAAFLLPRRHAQQIAGALG